MIAGGEDRATIPQSGVFCNLSVCDMMTALSAFLEPGLEHLPERRLRDVGNLAVQGVIGGQLPLVAQMAHVG